MSVFSATASSLSVLWEHAYPHLERFSRETLLAAPEDIFRDVSTGAKQLWLVEDDGEVCAVAVTEVYETLKGKVCCIWAACGTAGLENVQNAFCEIETWARQIGCAALEIRGRRGWVRALDGFTETGVLLEKDLRRVN